MNLNESSLFSSFSSVHRYSARDVADLTFLYLISLHVLRSEYHTAPFAKSYAQKTLVHGDWDDPYLNSTDLYQLLNITLANSSKFREHLKDPSKSDVFLHDLMLDEYDVKRFLQNIQRSSYNDDLSARLLFRFERALRISVTNYKSVRRVCSDWNTAHIDHEAKSLAVTRLLQAMRNRANWGDLTAPLQSLAKFEKLEIKNACDPETGKNCDQPSTVHPASGSAVPSTGLSLLKQLAVTAGLGVGAYYLGKAMAGGFRK